MAADSDITGRFELHGRNRESAAPGPREEGVLTVLSGACPGLVFTLDGGQTIVGRSADADISLADKGLSRRHACIWRVQGGFEIEDMKSTNGTFVDGEPVKGRLRLHDGQRILLGGQTALRFTLHDRVEHDAARLTHELAVRDPLTRLYNRRHLHDRLRAEVAYARRHGLPLSTLLIDVDAFKAINDRHGHAVGDAVLHDLAGTLRSAVRAEDVVARYGGEEFAIVARGIDEGGANTLGTRVLTSVRALNVEALGGGLRGITVSVGIGHCLAGEVRNDDALLKLADTALYQAKNGGRDRCVLLKMADGADD